MEEQTRNVEQHLKSVEQKFALAAEFTRGVIAGRLAGLIIRGEPGIGKSHTVMETINKSGRTKSIARYTGHITPLQTFYALGDHCGHGSLVVFDDCDDVFTEISALNLLKAAVDTKTTREVAWGSTSSRLRYERFVFEGSVIILTNADFRSIHYKALLDRMHLYDIKLSHQEKVAKLYDIATKYPGSDKVLAREVADWIMENKDKIRGRLSLRTFGKVLELAKFSAQWRDLAEATVYDEYL